MCVHDVVFLEPFRFLFMISVRYKMSTIFKVLICIALSLTLCGIVYFGYFCPEKVCAFSSGNPTPGYRTSINLILNKAGKPLTFWSKPVGLKSKRIGDKESEAKTLSYASYSETKKSEFDIKGRDVIVFLHIQKTGGTTFGRHLVHNLELERPCECLPGVKRCKCYRPNTNDKYWLFSRYSTGWRCGLHADWTELTNCVDNVLDKKEGEQIKRRYYYITLLREPFARFISEFRHVQRGATWKTSRHVCNGREPSSEELPPCYEGETWEGVTLQEFLSCPYNLAFNRQTRMLADLTLIGCYNRSYMTEEERDVIMLASAKKNLRKMAFFGLVEYQRISQYLFEKSFNMKFKHPFEQYNQTKSGDTQVSSEETEHIMRLNALDVDLYKYAKSLFFDRYNKLKNEDPTFSEDYELKEEGLQ